MTSPKCAPFLLAVCMFYGCERGPGADSQRLEGWQTEATENRDGETVVRYQVTLPQSRWRDPVVYLPKVRHRLEARLDGELIYAFGQLKSSPGRNYPGEPPHLLTLPMTFPGKSLRIEVVSNEMRVGLDGVPLIGERAEILVARLRSDVRTLVLGIIPICLGGMALALSLLSVRLHLALTFGGFSVCYGIYLLCHTPSLYLVVPKPLLWDHMQYAATYLAPGLFLFFSRGLIPALRGKLTKSLGWGFVLLCGLTLTSSITGLLELNRTLPVFQMMLAATSIILVALITRADWRGDPIARAFGVGAVGVCLGAINDVLVERHLVPWSLEFSDVSVLILIAILAKLVGRRIADETKRSINEAKDLETARILQEKFMTTDKTTQGSAEVESFCFSASVIGGDWYGCKWLDADRLHVHLGDVTGHGTNAALLATYARGSVDTYYESKRAARDEPRLDELHDNLNRTLIELGKGDATMTVVSVAVDLQRKTLEFVNSGHPSPLVVFPDGKTVRTLRERNQSLLGVSATFKSNRATSVPLPDDASLYLYTDGLIEALCLPQLNGGSPATERGARKKLIERLSAHARQPTGRTLTALVGNSDLARMPLSDDVTVLRVGAARRSSNAAVNIPAPPGL